MLNSFDDKELMAASFNHCVEVIVIINEEGQIVKVNETTFELFGYNESELHLKGLDILFPERYRAKHKEYIQKFFRAPTRRSMGSGRDLFGLKKSGEEIPIEVGLSHFSKDGQKFGIAFITDITLRKAGETKLIQNEKRLEATIETAVDGICTINSKGIILNVNKALCNLFGFLEHELVGQRVEKLMPKDTADAHDKYVGDYLKGERPRIIGIGRDVIAQKKNGTSFPIRLSVGRFSENGEVFFTGIMHDMSDEWEVKNQLKKLNNELETRVEDRTKELANLIIKLEKINAELETARNDANIALEKERELSELKSRFVSMASHEFRTPLSTILSSTTLIKKYDDESTNPKKQKHYNRISKNVKSLTGILNDFLSLDKLESGGIKPEIRHFDLLALIQEVQDELFSYLKLGQQIVLEYNGEREVNLDPNFVKNVLINLLSNASKYSSKQKNILLDVDTTNGVSMSITDNGIGIPIEDQKHLFSRFFRAKNVTTIQGTGLGLNIVKKYVELMGGEISFASIPNEQTTFKVSF